jgi:hypothetical protein
LALTARFYLKKLFRVKPKITTGNFVILLVDSLKMLAYSMHGINLQIAMDGNAALGGASETSGTGFKSVRALYWLLV